MALVKKKENELTGLIDDRDGVASELNELRTRALSGIRAHFGPDSTEYGRAGGTPKAIAKSPSAPKKSSPRNSPSRSGDLQSPTQNKPRAASILPHRASRSLAALLLCAVRLFGPTIANRRS